MNSKYEVRKKTNSIICFFFYEKGTIRFDDGKWIQKMRDKKGKESIITRWVDENDQQQNVGMSFLNYSLIDFVTRFSNVVQLKLVEYTNV